MREADAAILAPPLVDGVTTAMKSRNRSQSSYRHSTSFLCFSPKHKTRKTHALFCVARATRISVLVCQGTRACIITVFIFSCTSTMSRAVCRCPSLFKDTPIISERQQQSRERLPYGVDGLCVEQACPVGIFYWANLPQHKAYY